MTNYPYPESVFRIFSALAAIPHGSGNTAQISKWCVETARSLGAEAHADARGNVIVRAEATEGYADRPRVILQGHMDMVCAKLPSCTKNMEKDGLDLVWSDEYLSADGTTLGGDDGVAIALAFALLTDKKPHPPLTVIITVDEETGMDGATALDPAELDADMLINIDSEAEGVFTVGCAGGVRVHLTIPAQTEKVTGTRLNLTVSGLTGGHSGAEIHRHLMNANIALIRILRAIPMPIFLCSFSGGTRDNVIPTECSASIICTPCALETVLGAIAAEREKLAAEYPDETGFLLETDPPVKATDTALTRESTADLLHTLAQLPNGVQSMNEVLHMPETSLNLAIFRLVHNEMHVDTLIRSGINRKKDALADRVSAIALNAGGTASRSGEYPAWEYKPDTDLERKAAAVYQELFAKAPRIETIHAGLECGILASKKHDLTCISIGPDILDIHTPRERLSIPSTARTYDFLCRLLTAL